MTEMKYTAGPWWIGDVHDFDGIAILYDEGRVPVANIPEGYSVRNAQGNAYLISAAPDLLEALMAIEMARHTDAKEDWIKATALTDAAIVKATVYK